MSWFGAANLTPAPGDPWIVIEEGTDPINGPFYVYGWWGREAEIRLEQSVHIDAGRKTRVIRPDSGQGQWQLQVTASENETTDKNKPLAIKWSLKPNFQEKTLWEHPTLKAMYQRVPGLSDAGIGGGSLANRVAQQNVQTMARLRKDTEALIRGDTKTEDAQGNERDLNTTWLNALLIDLGLTTTADKTTFMLLINARLQGVEAFPIWTFVLRKTVKVQRGSNLRPDNDNINKLFTLAGLKRVEELDDEEIIGKMPAGFWLKTPCGVDRAEEGGPDKWEFEQEYLHAETYSRFVYPDKPIS